MADPGAALMASAPAGPGQRVGVPGGLDDRGGEQTQAVAVPFVRSRSRRLLALPAGAKVCGDVAADVVADSVGVPPASGQEVLHPARRRGARLLRDSTLGKRLPPHSSAHRRCPATGQALR